MRHVIDEVVLDFAVSFLPEDNYNSKDKRDKQDYREHHAGNHEAHTGEDIAVDIGEMHAHYAHLRSRIVAEEHLAIGVFGALIRIVGAAINLAPVLRRHRKVVGNIDAVIHQFGLQVLVQNLKVDPFLQRFVGGGVKHVHDYFVKKRLLINISVLDYFLQRLACFVNRVAVGAQNHGLGNVYRLGSHRLQLERRIHGSVFSGHGILVRVLNRSVVSLSRTRPHAILDIGSALGFVDILLQITQRLVELQIARGLIKGTIDAFVKLLLFHIGHFLNVSQLQTKQNNKGHAHDNGNRPYGLLLHIAKIYIFLNG